MEMDPNFLDTDAEHVHDTSVKSVCFSQPGNVDMEELEAWMTRVLQTKAADIYRMKGVIAVEHSEQKFVYQGVHMMFKGEFTEEWRAGEERVNRLIFIGKSLDRAELRKSFEACMAV